MTFSLNICAFGSLGAIKIVKFFEMTMEIPLPMITYDYGERNHRNMRPIVEIGHLYKNYYSIKVNRIPQSYFLSRGRWMPFHGHVPKLNNVLRNLLPTPGVFSFWDHWDDLRSGFHIILLEFDFHFWSKFLRKYTWNEIVYRKYTTLEFNNTQRYFERYASVFSEFGA